jgi:four helix bundle protein
MQSYKELIVWQKSVALVTKIYRATEAFPSTECFGLTSQMRRAAVSIPANIAEGYARKHRAEYLQLLRIAFGSGAELETHLIIAANLGFLKKTDIIETNELLGEVMRMLNKLISTLTT